MADLQQLDPRVIEVQEARRRALRIALRESYACREHTLGWSLVVFLIIWLTLSPFGGVAPAALFACLGSLFWAAVHRARRL